MGSLFPLLSLSGFIVILFYLSMLLYSSIFLTYRSQVHSYSLATFVNSYIELLKEHDILF